MSVPRVWTNEEVRDKLLRKIAVVANYWAKLPDKTDLEKCNGVAFSILAELDGCGMDIPGFIIAPQSACETVIPVKQQDIENFLDPLVFRWDEEKYIVSEAIRSYVAQFDTDHMKNQRFLVAPSPHEDDEEYNKGNGDNWFPPTVDVPTDIGGALHELYHKFEKHK